MKGGEVVTIRVNPRDCMAVAWIVKSVGLEIHGMSFAQAVAIALSSLLESMRQKGVIPDDTGFEYSNMMRPFVVKKRSGRKLDVAKTITEMTYNAKVPALIPDHARNARRIRYEELKFKLDNAADSFSEQDREELRPLVDEFFDF